MDKPIYLGFSVLELSKLHMYETYYDILQPYFGLKIYNFIIRYRQFCIEFKNKKYYSRFI